jgi:hypothetical protein
MGPRVDRQITQLQLRPFRTSQTYQNLQRCGEGVFHVVDDVELLARCAVGRLEPPPTMRPATRVDGDILQDACRWYAFRVVRADTASQRATFDCAIVDQGRIRDFFGFNRAKHAVVEAAILATRLSLLDPDEVARQCAQLATIVDKTAGDQERRAFAFLLEHIHAQTRTAGHPDRKVPR